MTPHEAKESNAKFTAPFNLMVDAMYDNSTNKTGAGPH